MHRVRAILAASLLLIAVASIVIPIPPSTNGDHLLDVAEAQSTTLTIYSGRSEDLVGPIIEQFEQDTGIEVEVRYGDTSSLALTLLEEGENTPADVFFAQDAGALGLLSKNEQLETLPAYVLDSVEPRFRSTEGEWVGITGRARVIAYNTEALSEEDLPESLLDFTDPAWQGRLGFAPTNASFLAHLTAIRVTEGDDAARALVEGLLANEALEYERNGQAVAAVAAGEIDAALVNHYYLFRLLSENPDAPAANYYFPGDDIGNLINVAGAGILASSDAKPLAQQFIAYLLSRTAQTYFVENTYEYPLLIGMEADPRLRPLDEIETPDVNLSDLDDLQGTLELLDELLTQ
ncbi:MAG: iron ABC transporter substrate-binding protein [Chloroflexi bacterium]|nr:iron ABC transporter substrate-binding protein [Chloroflexota bacterium]